MIKFTKGNLLDAHVEALVNTVNTVGVMGRGIALMFKERFPENFKAYATACERGDVKIGQMFITPGVELNGPRWIINFPTKKHWRQPSKVTWVKEGLESLKQAVQEKNIKSIAIPPLGCGNGGLDWQAIQPLIEQTFAPLEDVEILVYEPTKDYQNVSKRDGVRTLTPARALIVEMIRRYWVLGIDCTLIETQKLAWFLERTIKQAGLADPLNLKFEENRYGPYARGLTHLLNGLDGSFLHCKKRITDATPLDSIWFETEKKQSLEIYLGSEEFRQYLPVLDETEDLIDGFQSPLGMEALATVDWLIQREKVQPTLEAVKEGIRQWPFGPIHAQRKEKLFSDELLNLALHRLYPEFT